MAKARRCYYVSNKRDGNTKKKEQAEKQWQTLEAREKAGDNPKWVKAEKVKCEKKLRKYGSNILKAAA